MMKKRGILTIFAVVLLAAVVLSACAGTPAGTDGLSLDEGIEQIARGLEDGLPAKSRVAVVNLESPSARFSDYVLQELQGVLVSNERLVVVERANLELLRDEVTFQMSGEVDKETAVTLGRRIGAQIVVAGNFTDVGGTYRFRFNAIDVETAVRKASPVTNVRRDNTVAYMLPAGTAPPPAKVPAKPDPLLATVYFNAGFAHYEAKRYTEAVADFTRALEVKKDDEASLQYRALAYYNLKDYDGIITDMSRLIQMRPERPENVTYYRVRGNVYAFKREYARAIADLEKALQLEPNDAGTQRGLAAVYFMRGNAYSHDPKDYDRAIADFNEGFRLDPNDKVWKESVAAIYYFWGETYRAKGNYDAAIANYNRSIQLISTSASAYLDRGVAYYHKKDYDRAIADYTQALRLDPNYVWAYVIRGGVYNDKGEYDKAIADYNQVLRINPNSALAYYGRGDAYYGKKDYARARADFEKVLQIDPNDADARSWLERLRKEGH
jgi:tetratricopeptide (TPR) repeat protein